MIYKDIAWHDLEISETLVIGLEVFLSGEFASRSLEFFWVSFSNFDTEVSQSKESQLQQASV